ncbi:WD40-repeat-containing domain protein [Chytriomyces sp. MP71]|nr:WD40-repeat-containing domain protein [Chytriomyces sp. MP71]
MSENQVEKGTKMMKMEGNGANVQSLGHVTVQGDYARDVERVVRGTARSTSFWVSVKEADTVHAHATVSCRSRSVSGEPGTDGGPNVRCDSDSARVSLTLVGNSRLRVNNATVVVPPSLVSAQPSPSSLPSPNSQSSHPPINALALAPSGTHVVIGADNASLAVLSTADLLPTKTRFNGHIGDITTARFFPSSTVLLTSATDLTLRIWDAIDASCPIIMGPKNGGHTRPVTQTAIIDRGRSIVTTGKDGRVLLWEVKSASVIREIFDSYPDSLMVESLCLGTRAAALSPPSMPLSTRDQREVGTDDKVCFVGLSSGELKGFDLGSQSNILNISPSSSSSNLTSCAYDSGNGLVATGSLSGLMQFYDLRNPATALCSMRRNDAPILQMQFVEGDKATGKAFGIVFTNGEGSCAQVQVSPDATASVVNEYVGTDVEPLYGMSLVDGVLAVGGREGVVRLYDL